MICLFILSQWQVLCSRILHAWHSGWENWCLFFWGANFGDSDWTPSYWWLTEKPCTLGTCLEFIYISTKVHRHIFWLTVSVHNHVFWLTVSVLIQAKPLLESSAIEELVDPSLGSLYNQEEMDRVLLTASVCIDQNPILRPRMSQASFRKLLHPLLCIFKCQCWRCFWLVNVNVICYIIYIYNNILFVNTIIVHLLNLLADKYSLQIL